MLGDQGELDWVLGDMVEVILDDTWVLGDQGDFPVIVSLV